jgi:hypothetical protein
VRRSSAIVLGGITLVGALLRIWSPGRIGLWGDEVQFLNVSVLPDYGSIIRFLYAHESHPPLFYFMAHAVSSLGGDPAAAVGWITLTASILLIPATWWVASLSRIRSAGPIAATLVALSVPLAALGVQLRPYSLFSLLLLCTAGALLRASALEENRKRWRAAWAAFMLLLLYLHHLAVLVLVAELLAIAGLAWRGSDPAREARAWVPWLVVVAVLAVPDFLMLYHQHTVTGYLPVSVSSPLLPFRQFARLSLTCPGELLLAVAASIAVIVSGWRRAWSATADFPRVARVLGGIFLLLCLMLALAGYRQSVLVEHLVLPFAPLGLVVAGIIISVAFAQRRRLAAVVWTQLAVACLVLSTLFTVRWSKTNLDLIAAYVDAEAAPGDLVILFPGSFGPALNRYLRRPHSQIDFPVIGAVRVYSFDRHGARIRDPVPIRMARDSIVAAASRGRRVWMISPSKWLAETGAAGEVPDPQSSEAAAFRERAGILHGRLLQLYGAPSIPMSFQHVSWSMEVLSLELFAQNARAR